MIRYSQRPSVARGTVQNTLPVRARLMKGIAYAVFAAATQHSVAGAQENTWLGTGDQDWYTDENWSEDDAPLTFGQSHIVVIDVAGPNAPVIEYFDDPWEMDRVATSSSLIVGSTGNGELTVRNGGSYWGGRLTIGDQAGSSGLVTVRDGGSSFTVTDWYSYVGRSGEGTLVIDGGASFENDTTWIGWAAGSEGHVTVSGPGSTWTGLRTQATTFPEIYVGNAGTGSLTVENGGSVLNMSAVHVGREAGGNGTVTVTGPGSYLRSGSFNIGGGTMSGFTGTGTLIISDGGTVDSFASFVGRNGAGTASVSGVGSSWDINGRLVVGESNSGLLTIADGGVVSATEGALGQSSAGGIGTVLVDGADSQWTISDDLFVGVRGEGALTVSDGGHVAVGGTLHITEQHASGTGTVYIGGNAAPTAAGTVAVSEILFGQGDGTLVFNHTGAGHLFDTPLRSVEAGQGRLSHQAGTTVFSGDSSEFSGETRISGGSVYLTGALSGPVTVDATSPDGAVLGGTGRLGGNVTVVNGMLTPGLEEGTLTIDGNLVLGSGAVLRYDLGSPSGIPGVDSDLLVVGGDLELDGTLEVTDVGGFGEGLYRLINYAGGLTDNGLAIGSRVPEGYDDTNLTVQTAIAGEINLLVGEIDDPGSGPGGVAGALRFWNGTQTSPTGSVTGGSGIWSVGGTNWTDADGAQVGSYEPDTMLIFAGAPGTVTVDSSEGPISPGGMQFATDGYTLTADTITLDGSVTIRVGDGTSAGSAMTAQIDSDLDGWGMLIKDDLGTLVLTGEGNRYRGGTIVYAGTLAGNGDSLPGDIINEGVVEFRENDSSTYLGDIIGTGTVTKTGSGEIHMTGRNSYTGGTIIREGILRGDTDSLQGNIDTGFSSDNIVIFDQDGDGIYAGNIIEGGRLRKEGAGLVHLSGVNTYYGGTQVIEGTLSGTTDSLQGGISIAADGTLLFDQDSDGAFDGQFGGRGTLMKDGLGTLTVTGLEGDSSTFLGDVQVRNGTLVAETAIGRGGLFVSSPGHLQGTVYTLAGDIINHGVLTITEDSDETYFGRLSGNGGGLFIKDGDGFLRLTGVNNFEGRTEVRAGVLYGDTQSLTGRLFTLLEDTTLAFEQNADGTFTSEISGAGGVFKTGTAELHLTGTNNYSGGTLIQEGSLRGSTNSLQGDIDTGPSASNNLIFDQDSDGAFAGNVSGDGRLVKDGAGEVRLSGATNHAGGTYVLGGTLSGTTESLQGFVAIYDNGTLEFDQDSSGSFDGQLLGSGILEKAGDGILTLTGIEGGSSNFLGEVRVRNGTLVVETPIGQGGFVVNSPAHLQGRVDTLAGDIINHGTLTITENGDATYAGRLSGNGGGLFIKEGGGILRLTGVNNFSGRTDIRAGALHGNTQSLTGNMFTLLEDAALVFSQATDGQFSGDILGFGAVFKTGAGELHLTGANNYSGGTFLLEGSLRGDTGSLGGNIDTGGTGNILTFDQDIDGIYSGDISGGGWVVKRGTGLVRLAGTTSHTGGTTVFGGTLSGTTASLQGHVAIIGASTLVFDQDSNGSFDGELAGTGNLIKDGTGAVTLAGDSSNFTGQTDILAGVLAVNGSLGGDIILSGGTLKGTGSVGNVTAGDGSTFAPGNSIGQSNAVNVAFETGSVFEVELNDSGFAPGVNHDSIHVTGIATLNGGTVDVRPENGSDTGQTYQPGTYAILTADGGITGTFEEVRDSFVFLDFDLGYDPSTVYLNSRQVLQFSDVAQTENQAQIAAALEALDGRNDIVNALILQTSEDAARRALDELTGEIHGSLATALVSRSRLSRNAVSERAEALAGRPGTAAWFQAVGGTQRWDAQASAASVKNSLQGILLGADAGVGDNLRLGVFGGYTDSSTKVAARRSSASVGSVQIGVYGTGRWVGADLYAGAGIDWHAVDTSRMIEIGNFSDQPESDYSARTRQIYGGISYAIRAGALELSPFAEAALVGYSSDRFLETGGAGALEGASRDGEVVFSTAGIRFRSPFELRTIPVAITGGIGWQRAWDPLPESVHTLRSGSEAFSLSGAALAEDVLTAGLGSQFAISEGVSLTLGYDGAFAEDYQDHSLSAALSFRF